MEVKKIGQHQQNFGALNKSADFIYYIKRLPQHKQNEINMLEILSKDIPVDAYVTTRKINGKERLVVKVQDKIFKENIFRDPVNTIIKALNYASKKFKE